MERSLATATTSHASGFDARCAISATAEIILRYRNYDNHEGGDDLDSVRHNLRVPRTANLPDTRLIICSMEGEENYPAIDKLLTESELNNTVDRVIITAEPEYLVKFTTTSQVISNQRRFMNAANGQK